MKKNLCRFLAVSLMAVISYAYADKPQFCENVADIFLKDNGISNGFGEKVNPDYKVSFSEGLDPYHPKQSDHFDNLQNEDDGRPAVYTFKYKDKDSFTADIHSKFGDKQESTMSVHDARNVQDNHYDMMPVVYNYKLTLDHTCRISNIYVQRIFNGEEDITNLDALSCRSTDGENFSKSIRERAMKLCSLYKNYFAAYVDGKILKSPESKIESVSDSSKKNTTVKPAVSGAGPKANTSHKSAH